MVSLSKDLFLLKSFKQIWKIGRNSQETASYAEESEREFSFLEGWAMEELICLRLYNCYAH